MAGGDLTRLIAPNGSTVKVDSERAKVLLGQGYKAATEKKASAKRSTSKSDSE